MNCYTNYGKGSFAYFCEGYNQVSVGVTLIFRTTGGDNCISESAVAMTNDNYVYVTAETRHFGAVLANLATTKLTF